MISLVAALLLSAQAAVGPPAPAQTILPGVLDLDFVEGTAISAECLGFRARLSVSAGAFECLDTHYGASQAQVAAYARAVEAKGWRSDGGVVNVLYMVRPLTSGGCAKLTMAAVPGTETRLPEDKAVILFAVDRIPVCPTPASTPAPAQ